MANHQSTNNVWSKRVPFLLIVLLLLLWLMGKGPGAECCTPQGDETLPTEATLPQPFSFTATANEISSNGDAKKAAWLTKADALKNLLAGDLKAEGDEKLVTLSGTVDSEAIKQQKEADAKAFFGAGVAIDNQLTMKEIAPAAPEPTPTPAATAPAPAKIFFEVSKSELPADANSLLEPMIKWLKDNPSAKVALSGFHDATGNQASNELLAKERAKSVRAALIAAGIENDRVEMRKPQVTDGGGDLKEARRVEVSIL